MILVYHRSLDDSNWAVVVVPVQRKHIGMRCAIHHVDKLPNGINSPIKRKFQFFYVSINALLQTFGQLYKRDHFFSLCNVFKKKMEKNL